MRVHGSGAVLGRIWWLINAAVLLVFSFVLSSCVGIIPKPPVDPIPVPTDVGSIRVHVMDSVTRASVNKVVVRVTNSSLVDGIDNRELRLEACDQGQFLVVAAPGYETNFTPCVYQQQLYEVHLKPLSTVDNVNYAWSSARNGCGSMCHNGQYGDIYNEITEWKSSAHARVFVDPYFLSMYRGTTINTAGEASSVYGPGFKLDYPNEAGNCAYCHAPAVVPSSGDAVDLSSFYYPPDGATGEGVTCDICHKTAGVDLSKSGDRPGVRALQFMRLDNFVFGPFANIAIPGSLDTARHGTSSCSPVLGTSEFCAACHYGKFDDIMIYNSYGEWRESIYGKNPEKASYRTCQDCHMSPKNSDNQQPARGACFEPDAGYPNSDHNLLNFSKDEFGNDIPRMVQHAASLGVKLKYDVGSNSLNVRVKVENQKAGHKFPTDTPLRHLILVVNVADEFEYLLTPVEGPRLPSWAGVSNDEMNKRGVSGYADQAGMIYANLLVDERTNTWPAMSYWNPTRYLFEGEEGKNSDTRLAPRDPQVSEYTFPVPDLGDVHVTVRLIYRYAFFDLMDQKDWVRPDVIVATADCRMPIGQVQEMDCAEIKP